MGEIIGCYLGDTNEAPLGSYVGDSVVCIGMEDMGPTYRIYDSTEGTHEGSEVG